MHHQRGGNLAPQLERTELIHLIMHLQADHFGKISEEIRTVKNKKIGIGKILDLDHRTEPLNMR